MNTTPPIICDLDAAVHERLHLRAIDHGRSMGDEVLSILEMLLNADEGQPERNLAEFIHARFEPLGGIDLQLPLRGPVREPPRFN